MAQPYVFICYRRSTSQTIALRIFDYLARRFGRVQVFADTETIVPGEAFPARISAAIGRADVALVLIGPDWASIANGGSLPRLFEDQDFVRREIRELVQRHVRIIPVLVDGGTMPSAGELPPDIRVVTELHAVSVRNRAFDEDLATLAATIQPGGVLNLIPLIAVAAWAAGYLANQLSTGGASLADSTSLLSRLYPYAALSTGALYGTLTAGIGFALRGAFAVPSDWLPRTVALVAAAATVARLATGPLEGNTLLTVGIRTAALWTAITAAVLVGTAFLNRLGFRRVVAIAVAGGLAAAAGSCAAVLLRGVLPGGGYLDAFRNAVDAPLRWTALAIGILAFVPVSLRLKARYAAELFVAAFLGSLTSNLLSTAFDGNARVFSTFGLSTAIQFSIMAPVGAAGAMRIAAARHAQRGNTLTATPIESGHQHAIS